MRECSRKRPTIERTRMLSLMPGMPGPQAADAADDQVDRHAGLRRAIERADHLIVGDRVHLDDDARRPRAAGVLGLAVDQLGEPVAQLHRRDEQRLELALIRVAGQIVEDVRDVRHDVGIGGEQTQVGVDLRRLRVVVAGAGVHVALHAVGLLPHDQTQLRVRLQLGKAVDDVDAVRLQPPRPEDVVALVEARLELDEHRDLLAGFGRGDEQRNQRRVRANAVQRHLDRDDVRILHRRAQERLHRSERLERDDGRARPGSGSSRRSLPGPRRRATGVRGWNGASFSSGR